MILGAGGIAATHFGKNGSLRFSFLPDRPLIRNIGPSRTRLCVWLEGSLGQTGARGMRSRRFAASAAVCGTVVLAGWAAAQLAGFGSPGIENAGAPVEESRITLAA